MNFPLRPYLPIDADALAEIFREAVYLLAQEHYSEDQREAWMNVANDEEAFAERLASQLTIVALDAGEPAAFISLQGKEHIDMLYVHPGFAREGAGSDLLSAIEKLAAARGAEFLTADVSDNAKPFFEHHGFIAERRGMALREDEYLANTVMRKPLTETARKTMADARAKAMRGLQ